MVIVCNRSLFNKYGWMAFVCYFENSKGTSMTQTEALRLALEALEYEAQKGNDNAYQSEREAIKAALEAKDEAEHSDELTIAYMSGLHRGKEVAQRTWVGLTNQELADCWDTIPERAMRRVEAKLKEKNT